MSIPADTGVTRIDTNNVDSVVALAASCGVSVQRARSAVELAGPDENDIRNHLQKVLFLDSNIAEEKKRILQGQ